MPVSMTTDTPSRIADLKVVGRLMTLDAGLYCIFHASGVEAPAGEGSEGLPGVRVSRAPGPGGVGVGIATFDTEGWLGAARNAALIRVTQSPGQILVTIYHDPAQKIEAPRMQVVRLADAAFAARMPTMAPPPSDLDPRSPVPVAPAATGQTQAKAQAGERPVGELTAHIQRRGDVAAALADWIGTPGSRNWIEGFAIAPTHLITAEDIEYQAVLGRGWLSPWAAGGQFCGSRGMALPILGLRVRLKPSVADRYRCRVWANFTDGSRLGPVADGTVAEAESAAPLEAFRIEIVPAVESESPDEGEQALLADVAAVQTKSARRSRKPADGASPEVETPAEPSRARRARPAAAVVESPAVGGVAPRVRAAEQRAEPPAKTVGTRRSRHAESAEEALPIEVIHPGRGRKAPGSRVGLLKARRQMVARRRSRQEP